MSIRIHLFSFGHSFGVPKNVDLIYSVRHFPETNIENYQQYDGRHSRIQNELLHLTEYKDLIQTIIEQVKTYIQEHNQTSIEVAVGCERGRHRSVAVVERLAELLGESYSIEIDHRDLKRTEHDKNKQKQRMKNRDEKYQTYDDDAD